MEIINGNLDNLIEVFNEPGVEGGGSCWYLMGCSNDGGCIVMPCINDGCFIDTCPFQLCNCWGGFGCNKYN